MTVRLSATELVELVLDEGSWPPPGDASQLVLHGRVVGQVLQRR